jgi:hypothetical protein
MARDPGQPSALSPAAVPIHDDSDMAWDLSRFEETVLKLFVVPCCLFERQFSPFFAINSDVIKNLTIFANKVKEKFGHLKRIGEMS